MSQEESSRTMPFLDHLEELRARIFRALVVFVVGIILSYFFVADWVMEFLKAPLFEVLPLDQQKLHFTTLFENFLTHLKIAGYSALVLFSPYFLWELWSFVAPGLYSKERKWVIPFIFVSTLFFVGGAGFAYYLLFPTAFKFFVSYGGPTDVPMLTISAYYGTALKLLLLFGLAFELPVLIVLLGAVGILKASTLRSNRRIAYIGITVGAAAFAPPDAVSMLMLMAPLLILYEAAILVVGLIQRKKSSEQPLDPA